MSDSNVHPVLFISFLQFHLKNSQLSLRRTPSGPTDCLSKRGVRLIERSRYRDTNFILKLNLIAMNSRLFYESLICTENS